MTLLQQDSPVPGPDPVDVFFSLTPSGVLIDDEAAIFDVEEICRRIAVAAKDSTDNAELRRETVRILDVANKQGRAAIAKAFASQPFAARPLTRSYTFLTDGLIKTALYVATTFLHPAPNPTSGEHIALIAVGGYGRGEMAPFSDVDLLFLTPYKITAWAESIIESTLYILWDLKLKVGHASRTITDCIRLGREDFTIRTAMLEHRLLAGDEDLATELGEQLQANLFAGTEREFIAAKLEEREIRHKKQGLR